MLGGRSRERDEDLISGLRVGGYVELDEIVMFGHEML